MGIVGGLDVRALDMCLETLFHDRVCLAIYIILESSETGIMTRAYITYLILLPYLLFVSYSAG